MRTTLGEICEIQLGKMLSPKAHAGGKRGPYLRNQNVQWGRFKLDDIAEMDFDERERCKFLLKPGDLLVCEGGEPGRAAIWEGQIQECFYQKALHRLRPKADKATADFLLYRLWLGGIRKEFTGSQGQTTIAHLPAERLSVIPVELPDLATQRRLATRLKSQMAAVEETRRRVQEQAREALALLDKTIAESFHGITPLSVGRDESTAPAGWRWKGLLELARLESGHTPSRRFPEYWAEGDIPWLALPDIRALDCRTATQTSEKTNALGIANSSARVLPAGTVALSRTASVGFVTRFGCEMATSQDFVNWVCGPELNSGYLMWLLRASRSFVRSLSTGAVHQTVYTDAVKQFRVCLPDLKEQQRIANHLDETFRLNQQLQKALSTQLEALDKLPGAFLREAFGSL